MTEDKNNDNDNGSLFTGCSDHFPVTDRERIELPDWHRNMVPSLALSLCMLNTNN